MRRALAFVVPVLLAAAAWKAAAAAPVNALVGTWRNATERVTFGADGRFDALLESVPRNTPRAITGRWVQTGSELRLDYKVGRKSDAMTCNVAVAGSSLVLTYVKGGLIKYDRSKGSFSR